MIRFLIISLLLITTTGCGARLGTRFVKPTDTRVYNDSYRYTVSTGDVAITNSLANIAVGFEQKEKLQGRSSHREKPVLAFSEPCTMVYFGSDQEGDFYSCSENVSVVIGDRERVYFGGVYIPYKKEDKQHLFWTGRELLGTKSRNPVPHRGPTPNTLLRMQGRLQVFVAESEPAVSETAKLTIIVPDLYIGRGFVSTLTYLGMASGKILFSYREFIDGMARPAFSQDIQLDYRPGQTYSYKAARFIVHEASIEKLDMTLLNTM